MKTHADVQLELEEPGTKCMEAKPRRQAGARSAQQVLQQQSRDEDELIAGQLRSRQQEDGYILAAFDRWRHWAKQEEDIPEGSETMQNNINTRQELHSSRKELDQHVRIELHRLLNEVGSLLADGFCCGRSLQGRSRRSRTGATALMERRNLDHYEAAYCTQARRQETAIDKKYNTAEDGRVGSLEGQEDEEVDEGKKKSDAMITMEKVGQLRNQAGQLN